VPELADARAMFTDWAAIGHPGEDVFAAQLVSLDESMQQDLGLRSTDAEWELDVWQPGHSPTVMLRYGGDTDLAGLPGKLARFGYRADGPVYTGAYDQAHMWTVPLRTVGVDLERRLLVAGYDAAAVRLVLAGGPHSLGRADAVVPLLDRAASTLDRVTTASIAIGSSACVTLQGLAGKRLSPAAFDSIRKQFTGTFTTPQAELTAVADPAGTVALDALTFPDQRTATANQAGRSAALRLVAGLSGDPDAVQITGSSVTGRVLTFNLSAAQAYAFPKRVANNTLGVDICPSL